MFLVATFLANSAPVDTGYSRRGVSFSRIGRMTTLAAWLLGILPLSAYFRSELTSRLTITQPPNHVDTVDELIMALDRREIKPCILRDGCLHAVVEDKDFDSVQSLERKLSQAFYRNKKTGLVGYTDECFECASRPGFVCFLCGQTECNVNVRRNFVESRDSLKLTLATTPVRKSFPLAEAYHQLLQRLFETALPPYYKRIPCEADMLAERGQRPAFSRNKRATRNTSGSGMLSAIPANIALALLQAKKSRR
ncbi:hypothetical protein HPB52_018120 [Rhipicephalus sanguineus]|uniref:Uncharacterized protein n=1 Tax=Rhipicephalus sanguineus TaxID=34632 RepID=A0A9D4QAB9_RHISA|nr:hypothetical protein HPB52_018120 [Rhipicephalus sanguineus]